MWFFCLHLYFSVSKTGVLFSNISPFPLAMLYYWKITNCSSNEPTVCLFLYINDVYPTHCDYYLLDLVPFEQQGLVLA